MQPKRALLLTAAAALVLCIACGVWLYGERHQYERNRALIDALANNKTTAARGLVEEGADPNTRCDLPPAPSLKLLLNQLLHHKNLPVNTSPTAFLLACGARWSVRRDGRSHEVAVMGDLPLLQTMLSHGADIHARAKYNTTALHCAVTLRERFRVDLLLQNGADINAQETGGMTPLMLSALNSVTDVTHDLLARGANATVQDANGLTALHFAVYSPDAKEVIPDLLAHGADPDTPDKRGVTPLRYAQKWRNPDIVRLLKRRTER